MNICYILECRKLQISAYLCILSLSPLFISMARTWPTCMHSIELKITNNWAVITFMHQQRTLRTLPNKVLFQNVEVLSYYWPIHREEKPSGWFTVNHPLQRVVYSKQPAAERVVYRKPPAWLFFSELIVITS